eukprot:2508325-Amphidinium_carterae.1
MAKTLSRLHLATSGVQAVFSQSDMMRRGTPKTAAAQCQGWKDDGSEQSACCGVPSADNFKGQDGSCETARWYMLRGSQLPQALKTPWQQLVTFHFTMSVLRSHTRS